MIKKLRLYFSVLLLLLSLIGKSQDSVRCGSWLSASIHYGFIIPVYASASDILIKSHVPAMEVDYMHKPDENCLWQSAFHEPETGVAFFYAWLGNPTQLGNMIGAYPFINFHLQRSYREILYLRVGWGLGYMPVIFNRLTNHKDILIGSHLNAMINLRLTTHVYLSDKMRLEAGFGITHCSDGNFQTPNLGINLLTVNTGVSYCLESHKCAPRPIVDTIAQHKKIENTFFLAVGLSQREPPGQAWYGAISFNYDAYYVLNSKNKIGLGVDVFNNNTNIAKMADQGIYVTSPLQNIQFGAEVCYELMIGRLALPIDAGYYVHSMYQTEPIFNRIGLRYYANKHVIANLTLLTHLASADFIECGAGYRL